MMLLRRNLPELLAPAGNWEALGQLFRTEQMRYIWEAIKFSARRLADNFDSQALRKVIEYAHQPVSEYILR